MNQFGNSSGNKKRKRASKSEIKKAAKMIVVDGISVPKAMEKIGYPPSTANDHPEVLTSKPAYQEAESELRLALKTYVPEIFKKVALQTNAGLEAQRTISAISSKEANGTTTDFVDVPDHAVRLKYCEFVAKVFGQFSEVSTGGTVFNVAKFYQFVVQAEKERGLA